MALVDYSDSDGSESEEPNAQSEKPKLTTKNSSATPSKSGFKKVVDKSNPHRIRVELPNASAESSVEASQVGDDRPIKRARTAGAFGGFNSLLPAPKNPNKQPGGAGQASSGSLLSSRPAGLGHGVNLKTGAAPAFSREQPAEPEEEQELETAEPIFEPVDVENGANLEEEQDHSSSKVEHDAKSALKPMMFKPLSVGRKPTKKKKPPLSQEQKSTEKPVTNTGQLVEPLQKPATVVPKPKHSLFSSFEEETLEAPSTANGQYEPLLDDSDGPAEDFDGGEQIQPSAAANAAAVPQASQQAPDLSTLADNLGLTPAQRRQLFGRNATGKDAPVAHFSVSAEYSNNNHMLANEANALPAHNPVRSIAPGKHSLQQLLNAATSQKEALEEHFATGKRNKADAGSKYGW